MPGNYSVYPSTSGGGGGSLSSVSFSIGALDGIAANPNGASVSSNSVFMQSATLTQPGLVSSASQTFGGVKTFNSAPKFSSITANQALVTGSSSDVSSVPYASVNTNSSMVFRDQNGNASFNNVGGTTTTTGASGSITMSAGSSRLQKTIGSATVTFNLPDATTLVTGWGFEFNNNSIGTLLIQNKSSGAVATANSGSYAYVLCMDNSTVAGSWDVHWLMPTNAVYGTSGLTVTGTITATQPIAAPPGAVTSPGFYLSTDSTSGFYRTGVNQIGVAFIGSQVMNMGTSGISVTGTIKTSNTTASTPVLTDGSNNLSSGSISLTAQVVGILPAANLPAGTQIGSVSLTNQVSGVLPVANSQGLNSLVGSVSFAQMQTMPQFTIGSVTSTSSTGGAAYTVTWPGAQGSANSVPYNNGSGNLSWQPISAPTKQLFTTLGSNSYFTPANCKLIKVTVLGGGGGGGGAGSTAAQSAAGGGGGGGACAIKWFAPTALQVFAVTVGAGGPGGTAGANAGQIGSTSVFGSVSAPGGGNGQAGVATATSGINGSTANNSTATGGDINMTGQTGGYGINFAVASAVGGYGGGSPFGGTTQAATANTNGANATDYGSGGAGGSQINNGGTKTGGNGLGGFVLIEEWYI